MLKAYLNALNVYPFDVIEKMSRTQLGSILASCMDTKVNDTMFACLRDPDVLKKSDNSEYEFRVFSVLRSDFDTMIDVKLPYDIVKALGDKSKGIRYSQEDIAADYIRREDYDSDDMYFDAVDQYNDTIESNYALKSDRRVLSDMTPDEKIALFSSQAMSANINYIRNTILNNRGLGNEDVINIYFDSAYGEECLSIAMDIDYLGYHVNNYKFRNVSKNMANAKEFDYVRDLIKDTISKTRAIYKTILKNIKHKNDVEIVELGIPRIIHQLAEQTQLLKSCIQNNNKDIKNIVEKINGKVVNMYNDDVLKGIEDITKIEYTRGTPRKVKKRNVKQTKTVTTSVSAASKLQDLFTNGLNGIKSDFIRVIDNTDPSMSSTPMIRRKFVDFVDNIGEFITIVYDVVTDAMSSTDDVYIENVTRQISVLIDAMKSVIDNEGNDANVINLCAKGNSSIIGIITDIESMESTTNATQITA